MKLIRLTDDRYILDAGPELIRHDHLASLNAYFEQWWAQHTEHPTTIVIGGSSITLEYEDRRDSDLEARVKRLEEHVHMIATSPIDEFRSGPPQ